jgi:hypothetical protein
MSTMAPQAVAPSPQERHPVTATTAYSFPEFGTLGEESYGV